MISKVDLRRTARVWRKTLHAQNPDAGIQLAANFMSGPLRAYSPLPRGEADPLRPKGLEDWVRGLAAREVNPLTRPTNGCAASLPASPPGRGLIIAAYWPVGSEIDTKPLLLQLAEQGYQIALPVSGDKGSPLAFRQWQPAMVLEPDAMGMPAPPATAPVLDPDIIIIPALAFDRAGHRLGSGAGYYDITLEALRAERIIIAVAVAHAGQVVETISPEAHDQAVDWIVTEGTAIRVNWLLTKDQD